MPTIDIFNDDAFSVTNLTAAVNELPVAPSQLNDSGLFEHEPINTTALMIEKQTGSNSLVAYTPRGGPGETIKSDSRAMRAFVVPHLQRDDTVMADEVQNVRAFGEMSVVDTVMGKLTRKLHRHFNDFDMTLEHQKCGALKGIVLDKFGNVMENLYTAFGVAVPSAVNFDFTNEALQVRKLCNEIGDKVSDALEGADPERIDVYCGRDFWNELTEHKFFREIYIEAAKLNEVLGKPTERLSCGPLTFIKYKLSPSATAAAVNGGGFIAADKARVAPVGVPQMFITRFAPADYVETVGEYGLPRYAKQWLMPSGKGVNVEVQSNPISLCTRPQALLELTMTA